MEHVERNRGRRSLSKPATRRGDATRGCPCQTHSLPRREGIHGIPLRNLELDLGRREETVHLMAVTGDPWISRNLFRVRGGGGMAAGTFDGLFDRLPRAAATRLGEQHAQEDGQPQIAHQPHEMPENRRVFNLPRT